MNLALLLILGAVWGSSYLFIKVAVAEIPILTLVALRLTLAGLVMWGILRLRGLNLPRDRQAWRVYAALGLLNTITPYLLISWGEQHISSGLASLLTATMPLFTVLLAHFVSSDERITPARFAGVAVGFVGVALLMLPDLRQGAQTDLWGQVAVVAASLSYAGGAVVAHGQSQPPLALATGQLTTGAALMLPLSLLVDRPFDLSPSLPALLSWLSLALLSTVLAYILYFTLLEQNSATFVSMVTYIIPVCGLALGALVLDEALDVNMLGSLALILLGVLWVRG